jgi:23S rRNA pseudouridine2605 synthase
MPADTLKLQTFLAHAGITSRRKAEELIRAGEVLVNGEAGHIGQRVDPAKDVIKYQGKTISTTQDTTTYLVYKPAGIVSTTHDELNRDTIIDYLQKQLPRTEKLPRLYPVGRLDLDSEGLMILTNDGALAHSFTHPSFEIEKTYQIIVEGRPTEKALSHLEKGVKLQEGMTAPAKVEIVDFNGDETTLDITIHEGRYHQVKRMMLRVGYEVIKLTRTRMGPFLLEDLAGQKYRLISANEITEKLG